MRPRTQPTIPVPFGWTPRRRRERAVIVEYEATRDVLLAEFHASRRG